MSLTQTDICNKALTLVGAAPITSITAGTQNALILNRIYDNALESIMSECLWSFATSRSTLSTTATSLAWNFDEEAYHYAKPSGIIRIFDTNDSDATWRIEGDVIVTDTAGLGIRYTSLVTDPSKYPAQFIKAFVDLLCSEIAYQVINSKTIAENFLEKYEKVSLPKARSENAQQGTNQILKDDEWELSKYHNG